MMKPPTLIEQGQWAWSDESIDWEFYAATTLPAPNLCTAAFCVAVTADQKILLEREARGWGMLGGHLDEGEAIEAGLVRECQEEGGFTPHSPVLFGYRKIIATNPVAHPEPGRAYPFPISYIAYYWATSNRPLTNPTEPEVLETKTFTIDELELLNPPDLLVIKAGWQAYQASPMGTE